MTHDVVCQHTISYARRTMSYVFWRGLSQLFQRNQIPCPQQRQMGCALPTAKSSFLASQQARQCQKHSLCGVLAPYKRAVVAVHRHCLRTSQLCRLPLGLSVSLTVPILEPQHSFSLLPKAGGWRRGCCTSRCALAMAAHTP